MDWEAFSYALTTGFVVGKWVDGKKIYRVAREVMTDNNGSASLGLTGLAVDSIIQLRGNSFTTAGTLVPVPFINLTGDQRISIWAAKGTNGKWERVNIVGTGLFKEQRVWVFLDFTKQ